MSQDYHIIFAFGQSNRVGNQANNPPAETPLCTGWKMWRDCFNSTPNDKTDTTLRSVIVTTSAEAALVHGSELQCALNLFKQGIDGCYVKVGENGTDLRTYWIPSGGSSNARMIATFTSAYNAVVAAYPGRNYVPWMSICQGEAEVVDTAGGGQAAADGWCADAQTIVDQVDALALSLTGNHLAGLMVYRIPSGIINRPLVPLSPATYLSNVRTQQALLVSNNTAAGLPSTLIDSDAFSLNTDYTHLDGTGQNSLGAAEAAFMLSTNVTRIGQLGLSDYLIHKMYDHVFGGGDYTAPATTHLAQFVGNPTGAGVELSGSSYARTSITNNNTNYSAASAKVKKLATNNKLFQATGALGTVDYIALYDAASNGNRLLSVKIPTTRAAIYGSLHWMRADVLQVTMGTGWATYGANKILDHVFGNTAYTRPATVYLAAHTNSGEVAGGGYSRVAVTNNTTNFPNASSRTKKLATQQSFPTASAAWGDITSLSLWDSLAGGNQLAVATCTATTIPIGKRLVVSANAFQISDAKTG